MMLDQNQRKSSLVTSGPATMIPLETGTLGSSAPSSTANPTDAQFIAWGVPYERWGMWRMAERDAREKMKDPQKYQALIRQQNEKEAAERLPRGVVTYERPIYTAQEVANQAYDQYMRGLLSDYIDKGYEAAHGITDANRPFPGYGWGVMDHVNKRLQEQLNNTTPDAKDDSDDAYEPVDNRRTLITPQALSQPHSLTSAPKPAENLESTKTESLDTKRRTKHHSEASHSHEQVSANPRMTQVINSSKIRHLVDTVARQDREIEELYRKVEALAYRLERQENRLRQISEKDASTHDFQERTLSSPDSLGSSEENISTKRKIEAEHGEVSDSDAFKRRRAASESWLRS